MDVGHFREVLAHVGPKIAKQDTFWREAIKPELRLAITLRFLASGNSSHSLVYDFRVAHNTVSEIIYRTCEAIVSEMMEDVMPCPKTSEEWKKVAELYG